MTHFVKVLVLAGVLVGAAACANTTVHSVSDSSARYTPNQVNYVTSSGEVRTVILGNPFAMSKVDFDNSVTSHMEGRPLWSSHARYTTHPSDQAKTAYHVAMAFNPPENYDADDVCASRDSAASPGSAGNIRIVAAFCSADTRLSDTLVYGGGASGPTDPVFVKMIRQVMLDLFPQRDPNVGRGVFVAN